IGDAVNTVIQTIQAGGPGAGTELLAKAQMSACVTHSKLDYKVAPTLFFEFHGSDNGVKEQAETVQAISAEHGGADFKWATRQEDRSKLWEARHKAYYAALALRPGAKGWPTDVCVPISRLAECILETKKDIEESGLLAPMVGHVGDGNFHLVYVIDPDNPDEMKRASAHNDRMIARALAMGGTCTGEHGVGYGKMAFLQAEHGEALDVMRSIKRALDPHNRMNPGKVVNI